MQKMVGGNEQDDEFEMLLGEIPNATSAANLYLEESGLINSSSSLFAAPLSEETMKKALYSDSLTDHCRSSQCSKHGASDLSLSPVSSSSLSSHTGLNFSINSCTSSPTKTANSKKSQNKDNLNLANNVGPKEYEKEAEGLICETYLPDEQSLTSAFDNLGFNSGLTVGPATKSPVHYKSIPISGLSLEGQYSNQTSSTQSGLEVIGSFLAQSPNGLDCLNLENSTFESQGMLNICGVRLPFVPIANAVDKFTAQMNGEENSKLLELSINDLRNHKLGPRIPVNEFASNLGEQRRPLPMYSATPTPTPTPVATGIHAFHFLPSVSLSGVDYPGSAYQQQFYHPQGPPFTQQQQQYGHLNAAVQQLTRSHVTWQHIDDERQKAMHRHYAYLQQLQNQGVKMHNQVQPNCIWPIGPKNRNSRQPYYEVPIPHEQPNQDLHRNDSMFPRGFNESNLMLIGGGLCGYCGQHFCRRGDCCTFLHEQNQIDRAGFLSSPNSLVLGDLQGMKMLEKEAKQIFPEKILTRSHGLNSLRNLKADPISANDTSIRHANSNRRLVMNGHCHHDPSITNAGPFVLDKQNSGGSFADKSEWLAPRTQQHLKGTSLDEIKGKVYAFAKDQHGCRLLQEKFVEGNPDHVRKIFVEIKDHIDELMVDPFGNYLVQKLLDVCDEHQMMQILYAITRNAGVLVDISLNMHGTRAVQKLIETIKTPEQKNMVVSALMDGVVRLIKDLNGNHVVQRCLQCLESEYNMVNRKLSLLHYCDRFFDIRLFHVSASNHYKFLFDAAVAHCVEIATHRHGCCVLQKCLHRSEGEQRCRLVSEVITNSLILSQDQFGNYVVQYVFELGLSWATEDMISQLEGHFAHLSKQKFSSNVVEKCLKSAGEDKKVLIIQELIDDPHLGQLLQDPFANYVVQSALTNSKGPIHAAFLEAIKHHAPALRINPYGKRILSFTNRNGKC